MTLVNIVSALGNNNSIYPLLIRDCGIENVAKCALTYKQNAKESKLIAREATRERIIDEYGTSALWLGGIPLFGKIADKLIKKTGLSPKVDINLVKKDGIQTLENNIKQFASTAPEEVKELIKVKNNKKLFQNMQIGKFLFTTSIPIFLMGFVLPKLNYAYTRKKLTKNQQKQTSPILNFESMDSFQKNTKNKSNISFTGMEKLLNISDLQKMMILDGGLTVGRVNSARNKSEKAETLFKMLGMCYLNYIAPKSIEKGLNSLTKKVFGINTSLDVKLLNDKSFIESVKNSAVELPQELDEKSILDFIDSNAKSIFASQAEKLNLVSYLKNGVRDPRKYVDTNKIATLKEEIETFAKEALNSGNVEKFAKKAMKAKTFNTLLNLGISSFLLAVMLPKVQFLFRKLITGSKLDPGIKEAINDKNNK